MPSSLERKEDEWKIKTGKWIYEKSTHLPAFGFENRLIIQTVIKVYYDN